MIDLDQAIGSPVLVALAAEPGHQLAYPDLAPDLFNAFAEAKRIYIRRLRERRADLASPADQLNLDVMEVTGDPLPYGIAPNRKVIDELIGHALTQGIITKPVTADELFAPGTRELVA